MCVQKNAVILAAGTSSRFIPISYETPKSLIKVKGEILIERQINQLIEAGIKEIVIVVGYKAKKLAYLKEKYSNISIIIIFNKDYYKYNNISSLLLAKEYIKNTFICSSDNFFTKNIFLDTWNKPFYSIVKNFKESNEYYVDTNEEGVITKVTIGGNIGKIMLGAVYFTEEFSIKILKLLEESFKKEENKYKLWEQIYIENLNELIIFEKFFENNIIYEFDSLEELLEFDTDFKVNSPYIEKIKNYFNCSIEDISKYTPIDKTLKEIDFKFTYKNKEFSYKNILEVTNE